MMTGRKSVSCLAALSLVIAGNTQGQIPSGSQLRDYLIVIKQQCMTAPGRDPDTLVAVVREPLERYCVCVAEEAVRKITLDEVDMAARDRAMPATLQTKMHAAYRVCSERARLTPQ